MAKGRTVKADGERETEPSPKLVVRVWDDNWDICFGPDVTACGTIEFHGDGSAWAKFNTPVNSGHLSIIEPLLRHLESLRKGIDPDKLEWYA